MLLPNHEDCTVADITNILKLCVGAESVEDLEAWHRAHAHVWPKGRTEHITRMWPKREDEVTQGSLYWVIKGVILARQRIYGLQERIGGDGIRRCAFVLDAQVIRTEAAPRRPFQGWRYLAPADSPPDRRATGHHEQPLPAAMAQALAELGVR